MGNVYSHYKLFHYTEKIDSLPLARTEIRAPIHIRIKPTNACNHHCSYCAYRAEGLQLGQDMDVRDAIAREKMREIIADCVEMGVKAITFSGGGEPFCYAHLYETAMSLAQSPIACAALTNGALVKDAIAELFAHQATWLRISIDGWDGASYARYRGVSEKEFNMVIGNMRAFKRYGGSCYLGVSVIINKDNAEHIHDMVALFRDCGVDSVKLSPCIVSNSSAETNAYHEPIFRVVKDEIRAIEKACAAKDFEIFDSYHTQLESFQKEYTWCPYQQILPVIGADCNVYPCQDKAYNLTDGLVGSIKETRFRDFWFENKEKFFKINPSRVCNHHCVADGKNRMIFDYLNTNQQHVGFV
jgi:MoaA/NifB/PqqE/SkfB family radical SAM enzyme